MKLAGADSACVMIHSRSPSTTSGRCDALEYAHGAAEPSLPMALPSAPWRGSSMESALGSRKKFSMLAD
jgi:hypothetical protein